MNVFLSISISIVLKPHVFLLEDRSVTSSSSSPKTYSTLKSLDSPPHQYRTCKPLASERGTLTVEVYIVSCDTFNLKWGRVLFHSSEKFIIKVKMTIFITMYNCKKIQHTIFHVLICQSHKSFAAYSSCLYIYAFHLCNSKLILFFWHF